MLYKCIEKLKSILKLDLSYKADIRISGWQKPTGFQSLSACMCECMREREKEKERGKEGGREGNGEEDHYGFSIL